MLARLVRGDLDWIAMRALDKDRARRYETVNAFARDVERHLNSEPVNACPPSNTYRAAKFVRRHRVGVIVGLAVTLSLVAGLVLALLGFAQARQEASITRAVNDFLLKDLLGEASPESNPDRDLKLREVLDRASEKVSNRFTNQPLVEASIRDTLGESYRWLGELDKAEQHMRRAVELRTRELGLEHQSTLESRQHMAELLFTQGKHEISLPMRRQIVEAYARTLGQDNPDTLQCLQGVAIDCLCCGRAGEAEAILTDLLVKERRICGPEDWRTVQTMASLGTAYMQLCRYSEAAEFHEEVLRIGQKQPGWQTPLIMSDLGWDYMMLADYSKAAQLFAETVELMRHRYGHSHRFTLGALGNLAHTYASMGLWSESLKIFRDDVNYGCAGAAVALLLDDTNAYRELCLRQISQSADTTNAEFAAKVSKTCLLAPNSVPYMEPVLKLTEQAQLLPESEQANRFLKGLAEYRRGNVVEALRLLDTAKQSSENALAGQAGYFCAMIRFRQGNKIAAQGELQWAARRLGTVLRCGEIGCWEPYHFEWWSYAVAAVTRAEAERLILGREVSPPITSNSLASARQSWAPVRRHLNEGDRLAVQRKWVEAAAEYWDATQEPVFDWDAACSVHLCLASKIGLTVLLANNLLGHEQFCQQRFLDLKDQPSAVLAYCTLKAVLARRVYPTEDVMQKAAAWVDAFERDPGEIGHDRVGLVRAMFAYRSGKYPQAVEASKAAAESRLAIAGAAQIFRAMSLAKEGR